MKKFIIYSTLALIFLIPSILQAQPGKKPNTQNPAAQAKLNEEMEKAMKKMTPEQREQMKKIMPAIMPAMLENANNYRYPEFTSNRELLYKKDIARINAIPKKKLTQADILTYTNNLFSKIMAKGDAAEIAVIKSVMSKGSSATHFGNAAILCMLQGHAQAALGLSMKAVQTEPTDANWQNNMASLLTQYGYAEHAIPVLQKLRNEMDDNSTVLNNLGQAWFTLGETDSAMKNLSAAIAINPDNADAIISHTIIEETEGKNAGVIEKYKKVIAQSPNGFTESLLKNTKGVDWMNIFFGNDLLENITVHEYFTKDWIKIPELSDNVSGYENNAAIKNGYAKMFTNFNKDLQFKIDQSQTEIKNLAKQGGDLFAMDMSTTGREIHGNTFISKPARIIVHIITLKLIKLSHEYAEMLEYISELKNTILQQKINAGKNSTCEAIDVMNNGFLADVNQKTRGVRALFIEDYRKWLNAYCTWVWYQTANVKGFAMSQCLNFTKFYAELIKDAIESQEIRAPACKEGLNSKGENKTNIPLIPDFKCPLVVTVPSGFDWHALDNALKNFDENSLGIKKLADAPVPNMSIAYGAGGKQITQTGQGAGIKVSNGTILPMYGGTPLPEYSSKNISQKGMQEMMISSCDDLQKLTPEQKKKLLEEKKRKAAEEAMKKSKKELDEHKSKINDERKIKKLSDEIQKMYDEMSGNKYYPLPTLSSSVQYPNTFTPQQNLFK